MTLMEQIPARQDDGNRGRFEPRWNNSLCKSNYQDGQCQGKTNNKHKRKNEQNIKKSLISLDRTTSS